VSADRVLARIGRPTKAAITVEDMVRLRGDLNALQLGREFPLTLFPLVSAVEVPKEGEAPNGDPGVEEAKTQLRQRQAQRRPAPKATEEEA